MPTATCFKAPLSSQLSTDVIHAGELPRVDYRRLGQHFTPALLLLVANLLAVFRPRLPCLCLQAVFATVAGILLYLLGRKHLEHRLALAHHGEFLLRPGGAESLPGGISTTSARFPCLFFGLLLAMEYRRWLPFWTAVPGHSGGAGR